MIFKYLDRRQNSSHFFDVPRLKNRQTQIPHGLRFTDAITGWRARPHTSFTSIVEQLIRARRANPTIAQKFPNSVDPNAVSDEVDEFNAAICQKLGWTDYIQDYSGESGGSAPRPFPSPFQRLGSVARAGVAAVKRAVIGVETVAEWLGNGLLPVAGALAERRSSVCAVCPLNQPAKGIEQVTGYAAGKLKSLLSLRAEMELSTTNDAKLQTCDACGCDLKLKVFAPIEHIRNNQDNAERAALHPDCWILKETNETQDTKTTDVADR